MQIIISWKIWQPEETFVSTTQFLRVDMHFLENNVRQFYLMT